MNLNATTLHVFLDLEQTLIESWDNPWQMNASTAFQSHLLALKVPNVEFHIFSFAIWNENDVFTFRRFQRKIESFFNIAISDVIMISDIVSAVKQVRSIQVLEDSELSQLFGKADSWLDFCKFHKIHNAILFDDKVEDSSIKISKKDGIFHLRTVNVEFK
jgi:hypothetical protein